MALKFVAEQVLEEKIESNFLQKSLGLVAVNELCKLKQSKRILYVGAHPDDENNKLLTFLAKDQHMDTAYLSITRGEGGQNFIGAEKGVDLGILRVQESLAARRIEGTRQFFTRAKDFGFSESAADTLQKWDEQAILADMVWAIRYFRPDVMITRFSPDIPDTHGHHQAAAILTMKAYELAGDPQAYSEQLSELSLWQTKRLFWNVYQESGVKDIGGYVTPLPQHLVIRIPVADVYTDLHYAEIAAESRNKHRSQAMACLAQYQPTLEYFDLLKGEALTSYTLDSFFESNEGQDVFVEQFNHLIDKLISSRTKGYVENLAKDLAAILLWMNVVPIDNPIHSKRKDIQVLLFKATGGTLDLQTADDLWVAGHEVKMQLNAHIPVESGLILDGITVPFFESVYQTPYEWSDTGKIALQGRLCSDLNPSFPTWLKGEGDANNYAPASFRDIVLGEDESPLAIAVHLNFAGLPLTINLSPRHMENIVAIAPPITGTFDTDIVVLANNASRFVGLTLQSNTNVKQAVKVRLKADKGLEICPSEITLTMEGNSSELVQFQLTSRLQYEKIQQLNFELETFHGVHQQTSKRVDYPHIESIRYFPKGKLSILNSSVIISAKKIAYVSGKNDELAVSLKQLLTEVEIIGYKSLEKTNLSSFDAIVLGIRIYNTHPELAVFHAQLQEYVESGGVLIAQYNTPYDLSVHEVGAYPLTVSLNRVTDIESAIDFLDPLHPVLNYPNKIAQRDFANWIQDRALFLPQNWDIGFQPILRAKNLERGNEDGLLLVNKKGKGYYIYSSLSLFRQLPAGVSGAYRLFANMLSIGGSNNVS